jgi:UDP-N-acetyl-D-glucosamine dehydrogenase
VKLGIVGLGYVGLPLALAFTEAGNDVVALDTDPAKLADLAAGRSYIEDVDDAELTAAAPHLHPTSDYTDLEDREAVIVCVPTPLSGSREPDLSYLREAAAALAEHLQPGQLIVLESTSYPGTTREELLPLLSVDGGTVGSDFFLAFSPERIDPGRSDHTIRTTPKLVGGITPACTERARALYEEICDTVEVLSSPETAELAKLLENIFRSVNIALVNEVAQLCDRLGIDVWEVVDAAATKPFGFMRFEPGPGMGGHCLPVDPFYLAFKAREHDFYPEFVELAGKVNQDQPEYCVRRIERLLNNAEKSVKGSKIMILGAAYKPGIGDTRESPALRIMTLLADLGAKLSYHDPFVPELPSHELKSVDLEAGLAEADLLAIVTAHKQVDHAAAVAKVPLAIDFRGVTRGLDADNLERL